MYFAEARGWITKEQYGSRKSLSAVEHCLNKLLSFDLIRQRRQPAVLCSNDAKGCYDRIVHSVAALCMRRLGVPCGPIEAMFQTIQRLKHTVHTVYGDSERFFDARDIHPVAIQGVGQGNGAGPQIWAAISTVLLNQARVTGMGGKFHHALTRETTDLVGYSFVDNTDLLTSGLTEEDSGDDVIDQMQILLDEWDGALRATGGALEPAKTFWYWIDFEWASGQWYYGDEKSSTGLWGHNSGGERVQLEQVDCSEARRTLGVRLAPDGNMRSQYQHMADQISKWAEGLRTRSIPRKMAWTAFTTHLWPQLSYALPSTVFSRKQGERLDSQFTEALLPLIGINRRLPKALVHGAVTRGGLGIPRIYHVQGAEALTRVVRFGLGEEHLNGELLRASLQQLQLEIGVRTPVLELPFRSWGRLATPSYWKHLWAFVEYAQIQIQHPEAAISLEREGDEVLMEGFGAEAPESVWVTLNRCRIWLKAVTVADLVDGDGANITTAAWLGRAQEGRQKYAWPRQQRPGEQDWQNWREWLVRTFTTGELPLDSNWRLMQPRFRRLKTPLGKFSGAELHKWEYHTGFNRLYQTSPTVREFTQIPGRPQGGSRGKYGNPTECNEVPLNTCPATVEWTRDGVILTGYAERVMVSHNTQDAGLELEIEQLLAGSEWQDDGREVAEAIRNRVAVAVSDGTVRDNRGAAAAVLGGATSVNRIRVSAQVPGTPENQASFRSEALGLLLIVATVKKICQRHGITEGRINIACGGLAALNACITKSTKANPKSQRSSL
jgi:hypothetical protein